MQSAPKISFSCAWWW